MCFCINGAMENTLFRLFSIYNIHIYPPFVLAPLFCQIVTAESCKHKKADRKKNYNNLYISERFFRNKKLKFIVSLCIKFFSEVCLKMKMNNFQ